MIKLLLIEDDAQMLYMIRSGLEDVIGGYEVITATNGNEGLQQWKEHEPDIIVSDIEMSVMNGFEMVAKIRETDGKTPILFASGLTKPQNVERGYQVGVNNYIKKPYTPEELDAHIKGLLKLVKGEITKNYSSVYEIGSFRFDASISELYDKDGRTTSLTPRETQILRLLCDHKNETVKREVILEKFWPEANFFSSRSLDVFVAKLRNHFAADKTISIVTVKGIGLKLTC